MVMVVVVLVGVLAVADVSFFSFWLVDDGITILVETP